MENFEKTLDEMIKFASNKIDEFSNPELWDTFLPAFNRCATDERYGDGYVFDLTNRDDVINLINGEKLSKITTIIKDMAEALNNNRQYMICQEQKLISYNSEEMLERICLFKEEVVYYMLCYPNVSEYAKLYNAIFFENIIARQDNYRI